MQTGSDCPLRFRPGPGPGPELPERSLDEIPVDRTTQYTEKEILSTDENNLALEQVLIEILRNELENYLSIDYNVSFNKIVEQIRKERENFNERYQTLEKTTHHLQLEFENNMESIRQSYINTVNELNQELLVMKEQCEKFHQINKELVIENENLNNQLNDRSIVVGHHSATETSFIEQQNLIDNNEQSPLQSTNISNENLFETLDKYTQYEQKDSNHIATETISLTYKHHQTQIDPIDINHQQSQTESFHQLWPSSDDENNDQLNEYINELSSQSSIDISNNLNRECQQILSQQNLKLTSISNLELNHLALITIYFLYHQHLSDIAKELYNETFIRALQEEYNLLNNEKNDLIEHINSIQEKFQQIEDERLYSQEIIRNLNEKLNEKNYEQLEKQYNDLINENQLLKDYNALIYHDKLQEKIENDSIEIKSLHDVDIQCDLNDEIQLLNTKKSNLNNNLNEDSTIQQISNKQEIIRLKTIIEEIEIENKYLKDLYLKLYNSINNQSHDTDIQSSLRLTSIDNSVKTDIDNQQHDKIQTTEQIEENDWNDQISSLEFPLEESNITQENFIKQMIDNETQTDDQKHDKLIQVNNKLKRALQTIKEKIHHIVVERPELFRDSTDDTIERLDHLISAIGHQAAQIDHLKSEPFIPPSILSEQEIKQLIDKRNQLQEDKLNNNQEIHNLKCQLTKYKQQIQSSSQINQLINNETQTDDQQHDKLIQVNNKLKRALQTIKEKIHQVVIARPELFQDLTDDTIERLNHLISTIEHQTAQINSLQTEYDDKQNEINELQSSLESYQYQIQNNLSEKDQEKSLLQEHLNEIELQFKKTLNDHSLIMIKFELLSRERDVLIEQQTLQSIEHQQEIEQLQDELIQLKQTYIPLNEEMELLKEIIEQHSEKLTDLNEKNLILDAQKKKIEQQTNELENLRQEHTKLLELISIEKINNQTQTDDRQHEKLLQINNKLKRIIQIFKEKIHRLVIEKPNLFDGISEETNERLNHLISIVENQTIQLDLIQNERDALEKQLRNEIKELERSLETSENELNYEKQVRSAQLVSAAPSEDTRSLETSENELNYEKQVRSAQLVSAAPSEDISSSIVEDYQKQIDELEQKLSENNEEQSLLHEHLNKVEVELKETKHNHELTLTKYKEEFLSAVEERNELIEQQTLSSTEHQREIEQLKKDNDQIQEELTKLKQLPDYQHVEIQTHEDINALHELIEQQIEQIRILKEKCLSLANQIDSNVELQVEIERERKQIDEQINEYKNQIETLMRERTNLLEELEKKTLPTIQTTDNQCQTNDDEYKKLKRRLKIFKNKINRIVNDRPDLFDGISEETNERLDHLISTVKNQIIQINTLQAEHNLVEGQLRNEIKELQNCLEAYQHQIENERLTKTEQIVSTSSPVPSSEETSSILIEDYQKKIDQLQESLLQKDAEQVLLQERFNKDELELKQTLMTKYESLLHEQNELIQQQTLRLMENQHEIEQLIALKRSADCQHVESQTDEDINALQEKLNDLNEKNLTLLSQIESQDELKKQKKEIEEQLNEHKNQIENLINERRKLLEEIETNISPPIQSIDNEVQTIDDEHEKLLQINNTLKHTIETINDKINHIVTARPDLFKDISEEPIDHLDSLISIIENQTSEIIKLQSEYDQAEDKHQCEINDLESYSIIEHEHISTQEPQVCQTSESDDNEYNTWFDATPDIIDKNEIEQQQLHDVDTQCELITSTLSEQSTNDLNTPLYSLESSFIESQLLNNNSTQTEIDTEIQQIKNKIQQIILEYSIIISISNENIFENLDQIMSFIKNLQNEIKEIQSSFETYRNQIENERLTKMEELKSHQPPNDVCTQTLGLSIIEEHQKKIEKLQENELVYQHEIERLIEERDQARNLLLQWKKDEAEKINDYETSYELKIREQDEKLAELYEQLQQQQDNNLSLSLNSVSSQTSFDVDSPIDSQISEYQSQIDNLLRERIILMEQIKEITCQPSKTDADTQTVKDIESLPSSDETISRHTFEQEMLAWSKESEQLKCFVKQIQIENKKLKDIILKFERMILDYMHENERLKQENQHLTFINYSKIQNINEKQNFINSDEDICYLTLKYLTHEVAQRISNNNNNNNEQSIILTNESEPNLKQQLNDNKRQLKNVRLQNERLKGQLDSCTIHFKHVQNEMGTQIQEMSTIKDETERLRTNEIQYRLEIDRLKTELHDDQIKIQELERELANMKFKQSNIDNSSIDNLRELLELKERELNALKEKLDYTKQAHQIELQEAIKSSQFSLNNVKRFEQMDSRHQEKRRQLETTLGKFRSIVKPLIDNQQLFTKNSIININELKKLVAEVDTEEKLNNSLSPIRDCLSLLEAQMKDLHHNIIENHARRSKRWKYKLGFECLSCESRWEVTHDIRDLQEACLDPSRFIESSIVEPMAGCSCPIMIDFAESDVRLCLDDILNEVIIQATVT
ncbi:unnamed protein product [Rotaria sordida]|uniref:Uncharacterized protein n=1 Tax=Rotaria sordida TaxID=392033 RepID=A0A815BA85_9BILA|nr:unnamed protein product [Rotaria sordida]